MIKLATTSSNSSCSSSSVSSAKGGQSHRQKARKNSRIRFTTKETVGLLKKRLVQMKRRLPKSAEPRQTRDTKEAVSSSTVAQVASTKPLQHTITKVNQNVVSDTSGRETEPETQTQTQTHTKEVIVERRRRPAKLKYRSQLNAMLANQPVRARQRVLPLSLHHSIHKSTRVGETAGRPGPPGVYSELRHASGIVERTNTMFAWLRVLILVGLGVGLLRGATRQK